MTKKSIISAITLLLIAYGIFIVFQKKNLKQIETKESTSQSESKTSMEEKHPQHISPISGSDEVWYEIPEYGIRMRLNKEFAGELIYSSGMTDDYGEKSSGIYFSTKSITAMAPECSPERGGALGFLFKSEGNAEEEARTDEYLAARFKDYVQIGDYYYGWVGPQALCEFPEHTDAVRKEWPKEYRGLGAKNILEGSKTIQLIPPQ